MPRPADAVVVAESIAALRSRLSTWRSTGTIGHVPTMGALHAGHARLMEEARRDCGFVVASIFVNPLQFDRQDDLERYPRMLQSDLEFCERRGVDLVFVPTAPEMYPTKPFCTVDVGPLADYLCGKHRPGHFRGVATVVLKLFEIVQPDRAYFGDKDAQQLAIIRRMARDFNLPVKIVGVPTVRESDGLAISSRNAHLSPAERVLATALYRALCEARDCIAAGVTDIAEIKHAASKHIPAEPAVRLEYLEIVNPEDMQPIAVVAGPVCIAAAMWVGSTRLIDNMMGIP
jgi:pantoate--beta-alanine ligase